MDHSRWNRLETLFLAALELDPAERTKFLDHSCKDDAALQKELESMLSADEKGEALDIESRLLSDDATLAKSDLSGTRIGPYRLEKLIGEGGMGEVYLARRDDDHFDKKVALKRVRPGFRNQHLLARFRVERQILAQLTHPNITQLLDGGLDNEGWPYLVMQYVEGMPITSYCDQNKLTIKERIALFRTVCSAVQHAHGNLVVHRDLKPANILVTNEGQVKLLDFGIAKLLNPDWSYSVARTQSQMRLMTPEYAAPEQVRGESITTATDIYALGVLLYELLSGHKPYRFDTRLQAEIERAICEDIPIRPSTAISGIDHLHQDKSTAISEARRTAINRLKRILQGDLDNIVLMAMRKEPQRRYASVEQLSQDLQHYLDGRPVVAQKDTLNYRLRKFTHRNRTAVVTSVAIFLLLMSFTVSTMKQAVVIAEERDKAQIEAEKSNQVSQFLFTLFDNADPNLNQGEPVTAEKIVREGVQRIENELTDQPVVRADILEKLGRIYMRLGLLEESLDLFDKSYSTRTTHYGEQSPEVAFAQTSLAEALISSGRYDEADSLLNLALAYQEAHLHPTHKDMAASLNAKAIINYHKRNFESAESYFKRALEIWKVDSTETGSQVIMAYSSIGAVQVALGNSEAAEMNLRNALSLADSADMGNHTILTSILNNLGHILMNQNKLAEADSLLTRSLQMRQHLFGELHQSMPVSYNNLAMLKRRRGLLEEAEHYAEKGLMIQKEIGGPNAGRAALNLGRIEVELKKFDEAEMHFREAIRVLSEGFGEEHALTKQARENLSELQAIRR